jgi:hypothetical protein
MEKKKDLQDSWLCFMHAWGSTPPLTKVVDACCLSMGKLFVLFLQLTFI